VLHKGAAIGYHLQKTDEVYYQPADGSETINGQPFGVYAMRSCTAAAGMAWCKRAKET
jgi:hypothetical protein